jgi:hypothetical protein
MRSAKGTKTAKKRSNHGNLINEQPLPAAMDITIAHNRAIGWRAKVKENLPAYLTDSTALNVAATPVYALFEKIVARMPHDMSIDARLMAIGMTYLGMGFAYSKFRGTSRKAFSITPSSRKAVQNAHDRLNLAAFNIIVAPAFYFAAGSRDLEEIAKGTAVAIGFGLVSGGYTGKMIDAYRDFFGIEKSKRLPEMVQIMGRKAKVALAAGLAVSSLAATIAVYKVTPRYDRTMEPAHNIEEAASAAYLHRSDVQAGNLLE